ncbi:MAG: T9SS type A sorting domain-containing protein [Bacteroidia bacterium]|nr:T9SS type A sorting domain-containing protein [Bacteroidia bacterium]
MILRLLFFVLCASVFGQGTFVFDSITVNNVYRKYRLYVPNSYTGQSVPLVFNFHGYGSNAQQQILYSNMMPVADTAKFIIVYPEGTKNPTTNLLFFNAGVASDPDDVAFTNQLINHLSSNYNINPNRIYSCGMSNGGFMSYYLSCMLPNKFAAIGSVTGSNFLNWFNCQPGRIFPAIQIHGTLDNTVPYNGSATMAPIDSVIKKYRVICGLPNSPQTFSFANTSLTDNCTATSYRYVNPSDNKIMVELIKVFGGGHTWPGSPINAPGTCQDFKASVELWRFFRQHQLSDYITSAVEWTEINSPITIYPNPCSDYFYLTETVADELNIFDIHGRMIRLQQMDGKFYIYELNDGIYFVKIKNKTLKLIIPKK